MFFGIFYLQKLEKEGISVENTPKLCLNQQEAQILTAASTRERSWYIVHQTWFWNRLPSGFHMTLFSDGDKISFSRLELQDRDLRQKSLINVLQAITKHLLRVGLKCIVSLVISQGQHPKETYNPLKRPPK